MMKTRHFICRGALIAFVAFWAACGGGSSSDDAAGTGEASVESLASLPTLDLSQYDSSTSASANIAALLNKSVSLSKSASLSKGFENLDAVGNSSRAGCEANMHKQEAIRMSQQVQLGRCYPEAMEKAGFITIPSDTYAYFNISPPEESAEQRAAMCADIPAERTKEKEACEAGSEGPGGGSIKMRIGKFSSELRIAMCQGDSTTPNEDLIYSADGAVYTADAIHIGTWGGKSEKGKIHLVVDLGSTGTVTNGIVTLGTDSSIVASGQFDGGFGSGSIGFERIGADSSNRVSGAFAGSFDDPFSGTTSKFTGKAYSRFGGSTSTGCAKFSFTGVPPAMSPQNMIPFDIGSDQLDKFLAGLAAEFGIAINASNYATLLLCPNPNFDPATSDPTLVKPMVALTEGVTACPSVTHTGLECFGISNGTADAKTKLIPQTFTIIANSGSLYYDEVNAYDLTTLSAAIDTIALAQDWDCTGNFTTLDFASFTPAQMATAETYLSSCFELETKARNNDGMGGYNCDQQQMQNGVDDFKDEGGGSGSFGRFGGAYKKNPYDACVNSPDYIFINPIDPVEPAGFGTYCIASDGSCSEVEIAGNNVAGLNVSIGSYTLTTLAFLAAGNDPITGLTATFTTCAAGYTPEQTGFTSGGEFGSSGGGTMSGQDGYIPQKCIDAGFTEAADENACMQLCAKPGVDCSS